MKLRKKIKRFWTLDVHNHEGFTLVELIIVIAILAILSSVAVVGYSSYIKKANMQADKTLVAEIKNALTLYYYSNSDKAEAGYIILSVDGNAVSNTDNTFVSDAMKAAYGDNWQTTLKLKYNGWPTNTDNVAAYISSSFSGNEESLLGTMNELTSAMSGFMVGVNKVPSAITDVLAQQGVDTTDPTALANGAVVALATTIDGASADNKAAISAALQAGSVDAMGAQLQDAYRNIYPDDENMALLAAAATLYAAAEAYSQFASDNGDDSAATALGNIEYTTTNPATGETEYKSATDILAEIQGTFDTIMTTADRDVIGAYMGAERAEDANAFLSIMGALSDSSDILKDNLTSSTFYSDGTASGLLTAYLTIGNLQLETGKVAIIIDANGNVTDSISLLGE